MVDFYKFQEHWRSFLPKVLHCKTSKPPGTQQEEFKGSMDTNPSKQETREKTEETETSNQEAKIPNQEEGNP
jgi:hypothetical protein